ncbi:MAG: hypothetical protein RXO54_03460 [Acidilobus sp.]
MTRKGECYFYGSQHNKIPDDSIKDLISKADYVLLEGFDTRNKWLALKKQPCAIVIIGGILLYFSIVRLIRLIRRSPNDMKYVESIAIKMGKKTEYVDSSLTEVFLSNSLFVKAFSYGSCMVEIFMLLFMVGIPVIGILAKGPSSLSHFLSKLVILVILYMLFTIFWLLFTSKLFVSEINRSFRDPKVIERARELIERGYNVLIVRGCNHEDFIIEGLQKYSINCKVIHECPRILDLFRDLLYGIVVALARISRPLNKKPLQTKRHRRASKAHEPLDR